MHAPTDDIGKGVRGELVLQKSNDKPAEQLLTCFQARRKNSNSPKNQRVN
jgi:hypothetical protein